MKKEMKQVYFSVPEAAEKLGCSRTWVLKLLNEGELEGWKVNAKAWAVEPKSLAQNLKRYRLRQKNKCRGRPRSKT